MNKMKLIRRTNIAVIENILREAVVQGGKINFKEMVLEIMDKKGVSDRTAKEYIKVALHRLKLKKDEISTG